MSKMKRVIEMKQASRKLHLMGTVISLLVEHQTPETLLDCVEQSLKEYEQRFSANDPDSELMKINHHAGLKAVQVHPELFELIQIGKEQSILSKQDLNIAIGPLIQTWRIGFSDAKVPTQEQISEKLALIDPLNIELDAKEQTVFLTKKKMAIDLGCLAKGYIADKVGDYLRSQKVNSALINLGGNIVVIGGSPSRLAEHFWKIGIQNPEEKRNEFLKVVKVSDCSVVTSGVYERHLTKEGKEYHHIFSSKTGYPLETEMLSLTIVSENSLDGEIWTTRLFGKTVNEGLEELNQLDGIDGLMITNKGIFYSEGFKDYLI